MVYCLRHDHVLADSGRPVGIDGRILGFYSDMEVLRDRREKYAHAEGFRSYPEGFRVDIFEIDVGEGVELSDLYMVGFVESESPDRALATLINPGYPTREQALMKLRSLQRSGKFRGAGGDLEVVAFRLNGGGWAGGFATDSQKPRF